MVDENPFYRKRFLYECGLLEFRYFRAEAESSARTTLDTIPRAAPLVRAQAFIAKTFDEFSIQFWFGKHPTGRFYLDETGKEKPVAEDGAYLHYSLGPTGAVAVVLYPAQSEVMKANEKFVLLHVGPLSAHQLRSRLRRDLKDLVAYNYATTLDGTPTLRERIRIWWIRLISIIETKGEQYIPVNKVFFAGGRFLARTSVIALFKPWGILVMILVLSYLGYDLGPLLKKAFDVGAGR